MSHHSSNRGWTEHLHQQPEPVITMKQSQKHQRPLVGENSFKKPLKRNHKRKLKYAIHITNLLRYNNI